MTGRLRELEHMIRRVVREELEAHEVRRAAGETVTAAIDDDDDLVQLAAERVAKLKRALSGGGR